MTAYYSENDPKAAAWLRELIAADVIVPGEVDERDIRDVTPGDLVGFTQCHFFAGIGGWSYALRLAGWPDSREVWTGSCPCQPFSSAGKRTGSFDERHLWPAWHWIINACRPPILFGEQVASPDGLTWLDLVQADLEGSLYQVEYADLCAAGVGAPHIRQRLFWVAESAGQRRQGLGLHLQPGPARFDQPEVGRDCEVGPLGDAGGPGLSQRVGDGCLQRQTLEPFTGEAPIGPGDLVDVDFPASGGCERFGDQSTHVQSVQANPSCDFLAHPDLVPGGQGSEELGGWDHRGHAESGTGSGGGELSDFLGDAGRHGDRQHARELSGDESQHEERSSSGYYPSVTAGAAGFWSDCIWIPCRDGKARPAKSGIFPLAARISNGVGRVCDPSSPIDANDTPEARTMRLRGYGNSIVPQLAAEFILAYLDTLGA